MLGLHLHLTLWGKDALPVIDRPTPVPLRTARRTAPTGRPRISSAPRARPACTPGAAVVGELQYVCRLSAGWSAGRTDGRRERASEGGPLYTLAAQANEVRRVNPAFGVCSAPTAPQRCRRVHHTTALPGSLQCQLRSLCTADNTTSHHKDIHSAHNIRWASYTNVTFCCPLVFGC